LEEVYKLDPKDSEAIYDLVDIYVRKEEWNNALKTIDYLKTITGTQLTALRYRKDIYIRMNKIQEAKTILAEIIALNPLDVQAVIELADLYIRNGELNQSVKLLENTSSSIKNEPPIILKLIDCYFKLNEKEKAKNIEIDLLKNNAISVDYKIQYIYNSKVLASTPINSYKKYILDNTIFPHKNHKVIVLLGDLYQEEAQQDSALYYYNQALSVDKSNLNLWLLVINNTVSNNNYQSAYDFCNQALDIFPNNEQLRYQCAVIAYQIQKYDATVENASKTLMLMPENSPNRAQLYTLLGDAYFNLNQFQESDQAFQNAIRLEPTNATAYNNYAYYLSLRNEKLDSALYYVTKALELKPDDPNYLDTYGWVYYQKGDYINAVKWLEKAYALKKSSEVAEHLGDAYFKTGSPDKAKELWQESMNLGNNSEKIKIKIKSGKL
jgi:tetratricopeptide (TPR) repeat protein